MILNKTLLKESLSNFYKDFGYTDDDIDFFLDLYESTGQMIKIYLEAIKRNQVYRTMETYRKFSIAAFRAHEACYDIASILSINDNAYVAGVSGTVAQRVEQWNTTVSEDDKFTLLSKLGKFIQLSAKRDFDRAEPEILDLKLLDIKERELTKGKDFLLKDNRVILLGDMARPTVNNSSLIAKDIFVDYRTPEELLGERLGLKYSDEISKPEYRDFIQMVAYVLVKGPTIKNMKDSFNLLAGWEGSNIIDRLSATGSRRDMWDNPSTAIMSPFDFLVTIPASVVSTVGMDELGNIIPTDDRLNIFRVFLDIAKPLDTAYIFAMSENIVEEEPATDVHRAVFTHRYEDDLILSDNISSDSIFSAVSIGSEDDAAATDNVYHNFVDFPELPLNFFAVKNYEGNIDYGLDDTAPGIERYHVYRERQGDDYIHFLDFELVMNDDMYLGDELDVKINTFETDGTASGQTFSAVDTQFGTLPAGIYEYFARSAYTDENGYEIVSRASKSYAIVR